MSPMSMAKQTDAPTPARGGRTADPAGPSRWTMLAICVVAVTVGAACLTLVLSSSGGDNGDGHWFVQLAANLFTVGVGVVMWHVRSGSRIGPLVVVMGFASTVPFLSWASSNAIAWTIGDMWSLVGFVVLAHVYLSFPDGRTAGWSRRLAFAVCGWFFVLTVAQRLVDPYPSTWPFANPLLLWANDTLATALATVSNLGALILSILVAGTVLNRWRRGSPVARRALAPVFWVSPVTLVVVGTFFVAKVTGSDALFAVSTGPLAQLSNFLLPIAFLAGLLQTRLERGSIADLVRELGSVTTGSLEAALARAVHDPTLRLAFPAPGGPGYVDAAGQPIELPADDGRRDVTRIDGADGTIAILVHDPGVEPDLLESAAAASRLALENERLAAELRAQLDEVRASRTRIVEATDEERRRIERDLHDGAQQRLVALGFTLRRANRRADADPELAQILDEANRELEDGLRELRALGRGIHPTALADGGLAAAVRQLADRFPLQVVVDVEDRRLPPLIEATAYFIVAEALTNVLRHADATSVSVGGRVGADALVLDVSDDGRGGATDGAGGSGLRGLVDRAQAIGGTLRIDSPTGGGTNVHARLPLT
jgi:signal transduction histidine kinase